MRILLRADAAPETGAGHVMRILALGEELVARGHAVELRAELSGLEWLRRAASAAGVPVTGAELSELGDVSGADTVVVDSYDIPARQIDAIGVPVLAIVDGDARGIDAELYVDHNLGAEDASWPSEMQERLLAGTRYALVRRAFRSAREVRARRVPGSRPEVLVVLGGTDAANGIERVVASVARELPDAVITAVTRSTSVPGARVVPPGDRLPDLLARADAVVTAAGVTSWEVCTVGVPAVFTAVVENQLPSIARIDSARLGRVVDAATDPSAFDDIGRQVADVLSDPPQPSALFDGLGPERVAARLEQLR
jgi:spore coat polysaccharide biosynthesis predicted glycosyltransferase SpsG